MKVIFAYLLVAVFLLAVPGCNQRVDPSLTEVPAQDLSSQSAADYEEEQSQVRESAPSAGTTPEHDESGQVNTERAAFALGLNGEGEKALGIGDAIGDWTLADLEIWRNEDKSIKVLEATFTGDVALRGLLSASALLEDSYDLIVIQEDEEKIPVYSSGEQPKDAVMFMLNLPGEIAQTLDLEPGEQVECHITINEYHTFFAYMTAPPYAVVVGLELL